MEKKPLHVYRSRVYWSESDAALIAHFTNFFRYCERTEEEYMFRKFGENNMELNGKPSIIFPRVHAECDYKTPLRVHDKYRVELVDLKLGKRSITWKYKIYNETLNALSAECTIVTVALDTKTNTAIEIPENIRKALLSDE